MINTNLNDLTLAFSRLDKLIMTIDDPENIEPELNKDIEAEIQELQFFISQNTQL